MQKYDIHLFEIFMYSVGYVLASATAHLRASSRMRVPKYEIPMQADAPHLKFPYEISENR